MCARRNSDFLLVAKRKSPKKRCPYRLRPCASLRATCGARTWGAPHHSLRAESAAFRQMRRVRSRSLRVLRHAGHPRRCAPRRILKGVGAGRCCARPGGGTIALTQTTAALRSVGWLRRPGPAKPGTRQRPLRHSDHNRRGPKRGQPSKGRPAAPQGDVTLPLLAAPPVPSSPSAPARGRC